jgi:hypothetical protein
VTVAAGTSGAAGVLASNGNGHASASFDPRTVRPGRRPEIDYVSPLRGGALPEGGPLEQAAATVSTLPRIAPAEPIATHAETSGEPEIVDHDVEPALPDEARSRAAAAATAETDPVEAGPVGSVLNIHFARAPREVVSAAMETIHALTRERPGETRVIVHLPMTGSETYEMPLARRVAYDAELLAEVQRRLGIGTVDLRLS